MQIDYLGVQATLDESTSHGKTVMRLPREQRECYMKGMVVLFLNGGKVDMSVTCVDLKALELQRYQQEHSTMPDVGRPHGPYAGMERMSLEKFKEIEAQTQPPQPEQRGEWPKWVWGGASPKSATLYRWDSAAPGSAVRYENGAGPMGSSLSWQPHYLRAPHAATPTQAAQWLRDNGHAAVADGIDGGAVPAGMEGARVFRWTPTNATYSDMSYEAKIRNNVTSVEYRDGKNWIGYVFAMDLCKEADAEIAKLRERAEKAEAACAAKEASDA